MPWDYADELFDDDVGEVLVGSINESDLEDVESELVRSDFRPECLSAVCRSHPDK